MNQEAERIKTMTKKNNLNKTLQYQKIGNMYYPVFNDNQPSLGFYAKERMNYLREYHPRQYFDFIKDKQYRNHLFILNCFCEQLLQNKLEELFETHPNLEGYETKKLTTNIQSDILNEYVYQTKEITYDGKEFKITE